MQLIILNQQLYKILEMRKNFHNTAEMPNSKSYNRALSLFAQWVAVLRHALFILSKFMRPKSSIGF